MPRAIKSADFRLIDRYLDLLFVCASAPTAKESRDAQATCKRMEACVDEQLTQALLDGDPRAPGRLCYFVAGEVAGFVRARSPLGQAWSRGHGSEMQPIRTRQGLVFMSCDFYWWWHEHRGEYPCLPVFDRWCQLDWVKQHVIPLFKSTKRQKATV
jgi:hypothetical protein